MQELIKAILAAKKKFQPITKNKDGYGYKYATLDHMFEQTLPFLAEQNILVIQTPFSPTPTTLGMRTEVWHESGQNLIFEFSSELKFDKIGQQTGVQAVGSYITYLKRYHFAAIFNLVADEDDDGKEAKEAQDLAAKQKQTQTKSENAKVFKKNESEKEKQEKLLAGIKQTLAKRWPSPEERAFKLAELKIDLTAVKEYSSAEMTKVLEALTNAK
jgi:hypothetical protein